MSSPGRIVDLRSPNVARVAQLIRPASKLVSTGRCRFSTGQRFYMIFLWKIPCSPLRKWIECAGATQFVCSSPALRAASLSVA
jgi:hypothetical protein